MSPPLQSALIGALSSRSNRYYTGAGTKLANSARIMLKAIKMLKTIITFSENVLGRLRLRAMLSHSFPKYNLRTAP